MSWDELVAGALVGTARRPPALPSAASGARSALDEVLAGLDPAHPEGAVLAAGAVVGLYRQAGWRPPVDTLPLPPACPPETLPRVSEAAAFRLDSMLGGRFPRVLPEWLALVARVGHLVPPDRLPGVLDAASADRGLRATAAAVAGERGRWLAAQNPRWSWATGGGAADPGTWATGSASARRLLLERLRGVDPAAARDLLASTWATETPEDRAAFLDVLGTALSMADEPFLEAALDDRRKEVRQAAAELLWRLPESRLAARMAERALGLVRVTGGRRSRVEAALPEQVDAAVVRDGAVAKPPTGFGERAWWLFQLVSAAPLGTWPDALGRPPARLVELAGGESGPLLRRAWARAAVRQGDEAWAVALLDTDVDEPALLAAVPHGRAVAVAMDGVHRLGLTPKVLDLLDHCPQPWGVDLSRAVVDRVAVVVSREARPDADAVALRGRLVDLGARLDPSVAPAAAVALADHTGWWSDVVGWFVDLLAFRAEMREELPS